MLSDIYRASLIMSVKLIQIRGESKWQGGFTVVLTCMTSFVGYPGTIRKGEIKFLKLLIVGVTLLNRS